MPAVNAFYRSITAGPVKVTIAEVDSNKAKVTIAESKGGYHKGETVQVFLSDLFKQAYASGTGYVFSGRPNLAKL